MPVAPEMRTPNELFFLVAVAATAVLSSAPLPAPAEGLLDAEPRGDSHDSNGIGSGSPMGSSGWQVLSKRNFSSQIRLHPHVLVMVTVPWSGESRSLMKEIAHAVTSSHQPFGHLKLMVVYRNLEKMLADVLDATEGIRLLYYHHSKSFRYRGWLRAQSILSSVSHIMSLQPVEVPLKFLKTAKELEDFFQSTDKAVILLEFCGWSASLLRNMNNGSRESFFSEQNRLQSGNIQGGNLTNEADGTPVGRHENQKGSENEKLTCGVENVLSGTWLEDFSQSNRTASLGTKARTSDTGTACTLDKYQQFESFFSELNKIVREFSMPPERQSFGVISERSLLPSFGLGDPGAWCLLIHFSGVPNLSKIIEDVEDLRTALQMHHSAILEVKRDQRNQEGAFPVNRPSIILFVDRSSESPRIREDSKSALEVYKQVAHHYQLSNQMCGGQGDDHSKISPMQAFQEMQNKGYLSPYSHLTTASSSSPRIGKVKDQLAFMIMNQGESLPSDKVSSDNQDNHAYDILQHLLRQQNSAVKTKGTKISLLAKEIGFQLLSDDFDVKVIDVQPPLQEGDRLRSTSESFITRTDAQNLEQLLESSDNVHIDDSVDTTNIAAEDGKQSELSAVRPVLEWNEEPIPSRQIITKVPSTESSQESLEDDIWLSKSTGASEAVSHCKPLELSSLMAHAEINSHSQHNLRGDEPFGKDNGDLENCNANDTCYSEVAHTSTQCSPNEASMGADIMKEQCSTGAGNGQQIYHHAFTGSFFFSDGGYRLLRGLTEGSRIPSVVILDPVQQQHYALPKETEFAFDSLVNFIDKFLNGSLSSYQRSEPSIQSPREMPQPPFVNLDFHEADGIPRVTANTFSELVLSSANCDKGGRTYCAQKVDVLVFFSTSWCGFCQRMELVVREVYRSLKSFKSLLRSDLTDKAFVPFQDKPEDASLNDLPSIYHMDCTLNDCSPFLKLYGKGEVYPALVLFPAERENAFTYEGDVSVLDIFEFLANHGSNSHILNEYKGIVWNQAQKGHGNGELLNDAFPILVQDQIPVSEEDDFRDYPSDTQVIIGNDQQPVNVHITEGSPKEGEQVAVGSILTATDKLLNVFPFDKSSVLIVKVDQNEGFQGLILNKHINWDIFEKLDKELAALKQAPLSFGGPVRMRDLPLFSLAQRPINAYSKVASNIYFGDPLATRETIERIKSENASASDFWFFLGCSSWGWNQLFDELAEGAWQLGVLNVGNLEWPEI